MASRIKISLLGFTAGSIPTLKRNKFERKELRTIVTTYNFEQHPGKCVLLLFHEYRLQGTSTRANNSIHDVISGNRMERSWKSREERLLVTIIVYGLDTNCKLRSRLRTRRCSKRFTTCLQVTMIQHWDAVISIFQFYFTITPSEKNQRETCTLQSTISHSSSLR